MAHVGMRSSKILLFVKLKNGDERSWRHFPSQSLLRNQDASPGLQNRAQCIS